ncbi:DDB1- and CUL4-associated factor 4-like [Lytechinus variegatus]|uniref:DDB1- and CUL4-associated factor 4-like n=1 Tax=Lytechinus variegatus TaxID=7654 RepID=UPI001BB1DBD5|nr:DDB1- and CUL4-associated factor 4-like [Lytechinus variegatus]XP_041467902.1 DDB1- and CUL4-associated factor 4-like [Lytechinus variegatus]XP_041467903.1 DDB1- and CUL4-associated factor 4-like [Lytechinus variegatus]XP_041467905.1 DDB1- and CUL4-associated factor 4-like [Lytechinus variegatus]
MSSEGGGRKRKRRRRRNKPTACKDTCENADEDLIQLGCQEQEDSPGTSLEGNPGSLTDKPSRDQSSRDLSSSSKFPSYSKRKGKIRLKGKSSCRDADDNVSQPKSRQHEDSLTTSATVSSTPNLGTDQQPSRDLPSSNWPSFSKKRKKGRSRKASQPANSQPDSRIIINNSQMTLEMLHLCHVATTSTSGTSRSPDNGSVRADNPNIKKKVAKIPGFYYDEEKKRYFRILPGHSGGNVVTTETIRQKAAEKKRQCYFDKRCLFERALHVQKLPTTKVVKSLVQLQENRRRGNCRSSYFKRVAHETAVRQMEIKPSSQVSPFPDQYFSGSSGYISKFELDSRQKHVLMVFSDDYLSRLWQGEVVRRRSPETGQEEVTIAKWSKVNILNTQNVSKISHASWAQVREGENMYALYALSGGSSNIVQLVKCPTDEGGLAHISYSYKCISKSAWTCAWSNSTTLPAHLAIGSDKKALVIDTLSSREQSVYTGRSDVFAQAFSRKSPILYNGTRSGEVLGADLRLPSDRHGNMTTQLKHWVSVCSLKLLKDENYVLVRSIGAEIKLWDLRKQSSIVQEFDGHGNGSHHLPVKLDSTETIVYAVGEDKYTRVWSLKSGDRLHTIPCPSACQRDSTPVAIYSQEFSCHAQPGFFLGQERQIHWYPMRTPESLITEIG